MTAESRNERQSQFDQDPVIAKQAPRGNERINDSCCQRGKADRDDHEPADQVHRASTPNGFGIGTRQACNAKGLKGGYSTDLANGENDVNSQCQLVKSGFHGLFNYRADSFHSRRP